LPCGTLGETTPQWGITTSAANFWRKHKKRGDLEAEVRHAKVKRMFDASRDMQEARNAVLLSKET